MARATEAFGASLQSCAVVGTLDPSDQKHVFYQKMHQQLCICRRMACDDPLKPLMREWQTNSP